MTPTQYAYTRLRESPELLEDARQAATRDTKVRVVEDERGRRFEYPDEHYIAPTKLGRDIVELLDSRLHDREDRAERAVRGALLRANAFDRADRSDPESIAWALMKVDSGDRLDGLLELVWSAPTPVFWRAFVDAWTVCDGTWSLRSPLLSALRRHHSAEPGPGYLTGDNRAMYDALPDLVAVYRGCSRPRVRAASWTTDRAIAERFARGHRNIRVPDPVIAEAIIPKVYIFATFTDRNESEILLDPRRLRRVRVTDRA